MLLLRLFAWTENKYKVINITLHILMSQYFDFVIARYKWTTLFIAFSYIPDFYMWRVN